MARSKPKFRCLKCRLDLGSAAQSAAHFKQHPTHRSDKQQRAHRQNQKLRHAKAAGLPTVRRGARATQLVTRFCTQCGVRRMASHVYCGKCGGKL
jgi:hypothetical protein